MAGEAGSNSQIQLQPKATSPGAQPIAPAPAPAPAGESGRASRSPDPSSPEAAGKSSVKSGNRSPRATTNGANPKKRSPSSDAQGAPKVTKRRAARACVSCRARKVRCDVVEGSPCGNCRWDNVECIVQESRRRKKNLFAPPLTGAGHVASSNAEALRGPANVAATNPIANPMIAAELHRRASDGSVISVPGLDPASSGILGGMDPQSLLYQQAAFRASVGHSTDTLLLARLQAQLQAGRGDSQLLWSNQMMNQTPAFGDLSRTQHTQDFINTLEEHDPRSQLPSFIKPLPTKLSRDDIQFLHAKGALSLPAVPLQTALLRTYVEFVHPYMPLLELQEFLAAVNSHDGLCGQVSLLLYQAVMFVASAFVDNKFLRDAGYKTRKEARRAFFYKTRHLYDFDYESDRLVLVQALLLMSYWYETPDDQKDTWHWMGVAISLAHTIGLHRNPANTNMSLVKQKLWRRVWWSCFMRDRLIALGMRRPTRIKDEDFDVPMLAEDDFEIEAMAEDITVVGPDCAYLRDVNMQRELAVMCIYKAKLCICISRMLKAQYSVLIRDKTKADLTTYSTMMLFPNKRMDNTESVNAVDLELIRWHESLPRECQYRELSGLDMEKGAATVAVHRSLLHMVYYTTLSALHRPQFLPSSPTQVLVGSRQAQERSRLRVRDAAKHITTMAYELYKKKLDIYLPTTGVTVMLPAMIIHLLEMKNPVRQARERAYDGFRKSMRVLNRLRDMYAAADFAAGFLDAALKKASIDMRVLGERDRLAAEAAKMGQAVAPVGTVPIGLASGGTDELNTPPPDNVPYLNSTEVDLFHHNRSYMQTSKTASSELSGAVQTPPQTERDLDSAVGLTPSVSSGVSEHGGIHYDKMDMDFNTMTAGEDFDWNAVETVDLDQWLNLPTETGGSGEDMIGLASLLTKSSEEAVAATAAATAAAAAAAAAAADDMIDWDGACAEIPAASA